jgi:hypothetical protein
MSQPAKSDFYPIKPRRWKYLLAPVAAGCLLAGWWTLARDRGARAVLAFLPPSGFPAMKATDSAQNQAISGWTAPCDLAIFQLSGPDLQPWLCRRLEKEPPEIRDPGLKQIFAMLEARKVRARALSADLLEIEVAQPNIPLALSLCQGSIDFLAASLRRERENQLDNAESKSALQVAEESIAAQEAKISQSWAADGSRVRNREIALQFALNHYRDSVAAKQKLEQRLAQRQQVLEDNAPAFSLVQPPQPYARRSFL